MNSKPVRVLDEKWDYLIVLDACRYDYFEKHYRDYFSDGQLLKKRTAGTQTTEWLRKNFRKQCGAVYISANPRICSTKKVYGFEAKRYFSKIYDVWFNCWDETVRTVRPEVLTKQAINIIKKHPNEKVIIHYMQPHEPYIDYEETNPGVKEWDEIKIVRLFWACLAKFFSIIHIFDIILRNRFTEFLHLNISSRMYWTFRDYGRKGLHQFYEKNVIYVLQAVKELVENLSGTIVVTADHGEMLGEKNLYCHWTNSKQPILREVPWLVIEKSRSEIPQSDYNPQETESTSEVTKEEIEKKLRMLGYD